MLFKKLIAPLQQWLMSQNKCVGCGRELSVAEHKDHGKNEELVYCQCKRVYMFTKSNKAYRRALIEELPKNA